MVQLNVQVLTMLSALVVPLLVGLVTKKVASRVIKTLTNLALSAVAAGLATALASNGHVELLGWVTNIVLAFGTSAAAYYHILKPSGIAELVQNVAPSIGIGKNVDVDAFAASLQKWVDKAPNGVEFHFDPGVPMLGLTDEPAPPAPESPSSSS